MSRIKGKVCSNHTDLAVAKTSDPGNCGRSLTEVAMTTKESYFSIEDPEMSETYWRLMVVPKDSIYNEKKRKNFYQN